MVPGAGSVDIGGSVLQGLSEIGDQVVRVLEADRDAEQVAGRGCARAFDRGAMLDEALGPAEARRVPEEANARGGPKRGVATAADADREHPPERGHLAGGERVPSVRRESRVEHGGDARVALESARQRERVGGVAFHAAGERFQPAEHEPRRERRGRGPEDVSVLRGPLHGLVPLREDDRAAEDVAVPAEILGGGVEHEVGAARDRALERRRRERAVDEEPCAAVVGEGGERREVEHLDLGIARRLGPEEARVRADRRLRCREVGEIGERRLEPPSRQIVGGHDLEGVVDAIVEEDVRSRGERLEEGSPRARPGRERERRFPALQRRQRRLEALLRGARLPYIEVVAGRNPLRRVLEVGGEMDRGRDVPRPRLESPGRVHRERFEFHATASWSRANVAEGVGFEPTAPCGAAVFKTAALNHSATPPRDCETERTP